jgi:membrane protein
VVGGLPTLGAGFYTLVSIVLTTCAFTLLYMTVPNQVVDWHDAIWGGLLAGIAFEIAKRLFTAYVIKFPTYTMIYGAVAALPIFLLWVYMLWMITLVGALLTAVLPVMRYERWAHKPTPCGTFVDALAVLRVLYRARGRDSLMVDVDEVRKQTRIGYEESQMLLEQMQDGGWVGLVKVADAASDAPKRFRWGRKPADDERDSWVLLANPALLRLAEVYRRFVFDAHTQRRQEYAVVQQIGAAIETALDRSLADYFDDDAMTDKASDAALQKKLNVAEPGAAS